MEAVPPWGTGTKSHWFLELCQLARRTCPGHEPLRCSPTGFHVRDL